MKKPTLVVPRSACREMQPGPDLDRLLAGDYVRASNKPRTKSASRMRSLRAQRREDGWLSLYVWLSPEQVAALKAAKLPGETYVEMLVRLIEERSLLQ